MRVKQMGAIEICMFASRLLSVMCLIQIMSNCMYLSNSPICFTPIELPLTEICSPQVI